MVRAKVLERGKGCCSCQESSWENLFLASCAQGISLIALTHPLLHARFLFFLILLAVAGLGAWGITSAVDPRTSAGVPLEFGDGVSLGQSEFLHNVRGGL